MLDRFRGSCSKGMSARTDLQNGRGSDVKDQLAFDRTLQLVIDDPLINLFQKRSVPDPAQDPAVLDPDIFTDEE